MISSDFFAVLQWWFIFLIISTIFLPLTTLLFKSFFDSGYAFSKILGLLLISYVIWVIASLKIFPFSFPLIIGVIVLFLIINLVIAVKQKIFSDLIKHWKIFAFEESIFLIGFLFWGYIKAHEPSVHGLEKFMDFGFINSILRSDYFPPKDMWLAGHTINYYYFGHYVSALLIKLSKVAPEIGYNLTLASLFGLCFSASFSIGSNLYNFFLKSKQSSPLIHNTFPIIPGLLSAFLVTMGGNLHTIYIFFQTYIAENPAPFWALPMKLNLDGYWYPNATRFIPFTIHEFPIYSFVVSDLHGHVLDIPFVLLAIAILIRIFFLPKSISSQAPLIIHNTYYILLALLTATFLMTNFLDAPIYLLVIFCVFLAKKIIQEAKFSFPIILNTLYIILAITLGAIIFSLPFWFSFKPFGSGIGVLCAPQLLTNIKHIGPFLFEVDHCARSPFWMLLILWGFPLFVFLVFAKSLKFLKALKLLNPLDFLVLTLSLVAFILILIPEFLYVKDIYPAHYRANTVFKFGYQAFIILGLASGYMLTKIVTAQKRAIWLFTTGFFLFFLVAIYPYFAINSYFGELKTYTSLNGLGWLQNMYPSDYEAIAWINQNISGQPVILEAQGDSYTDFARVSSNTGLPTVVGWPVHEWLWRGSYDEAGKRSGEVTQIYESPNINLTQTLLKKYNVQYVFVGSLEKQKYTKLDENKFYNMGKIIFQSGTTKIYQLF